MEVKKITPRGYAGKIYAGRNYLGKEESTEPLWEFDDASWKEKITDDLLETEDITLESTEEEEISGDRMDDQERWGKTSCVNIPHLCRVFLLLRT